MNTPQLSLFDAPSPRLLHERGIRPARVYGPVSEPERGMLRRRNGSQREAVIAWFEAHPGRSITAPALAEILGLANERGVACRCSELVAELWLEKGERVPGPNGVAVHLYRRI